MRPTLTINKGGILNIIQCFERIITFTFLVKFLLFMILLTYPGHKLIRPNQVQSIKTSERTFGR